MEAPPAPPSVDVGAGHPPLEHPPPGLLLSSLMWGFFTGLLQLGALLLWQQLPHGWTGPFAILGILAEMVVLLGLPLGPIAALTLAVFTGRFAVRWAVAAALAFGAGFAGATAVESAVRQPWIGTISEAFSPWLLLMPAMVTGVTLVVWAATQYIRRADPLLPAPYRLCSKCGGYLIGTVDGSLCTGCGYRVRRRQRPPAWAVLPRPIRWIAVPVMMSLIAAGPLVYTARWNANIAPLRRKLEVLQPTQYVGLPAPMSGDNPQRLGGDGVFVPFEPGSKRGVLVIVPRGRLPLPAVRIWLSELGPIGSPGGQSAMEFPLQMSPQVYCDLTPVQADVLFKVGIPTAMMDAFRAAGSGSRPGQNWLNTEDLGPPGAGAVSIDAAAYLR